MDANEKTAILKRVQECLMALCRNRGVDLVVAPEQSKFEEGWFYATVAPTDPAVRVSDYSDILADVEKRVGRGLGRNLLLLPDIPLGFEPAEHGAGQSDTRALATTAPNIAAPMTTADVEQIVDKVQQRLTELGRAQGVELSVNREETQVDDGWLYVTVWSPTKSVRAADYAEMFSEIEAQIRSEIKEHMLLVPAIP